MTRILTIPILLPIDLTISSRLARRAEQGARPTNPTQIAVEKLTIVSILSLILIQIQYKIMHS